MRFLYTLRKARKHRLTLSQYNTHTVHTTPHLPLTKFKGSEIKTLIFDFDGVLANHGAIEPLEEVLNVLTKSSEEFKVYILSNKPIKAREDFFTKNFPTIKFVSPTHKKPYPDEIYKILQDSECQANEALLIDDRLLTGGLAAAISGIQFYYITQPFVKYKENLTSELFFTFLRKFERLWFRPSK
jgi:predicted HAD superfamily phosphohydrolase YqeG